MIPLIRSAFVAFFYDPLAAKRWIRTGMASLAMVLLSVVQVAGTDPGVALTVIRTWSWGDWAARIALGFLFSSVHGPPLAKAEPAPVAGVQP